MKSMIAVGALLMAALAGCTSSREMPAGTPPPDAASLSSSPSARDVAPTPGAAPLRVDSTVLLSPDVEPPADRVTLMKVVAAANAIAGRPYRFGGGHRPYMPAKDGPWAPPGHAPGGGREPGYDGSGAVSYVLYAGGFLGEPLAAEQFRRFGRPGPGRWITVLVCDDGAHMVIAGLRFDAHRVGDDQAAGPRWRARPRDRSGCVVRHPQHY